MVKAVFYLVRSGCGSPLSCPGRCLCAFPPLAARRRAAAPARPYAAVKTELRMSLPDVKSSHRVEALARGLGWATNASMRAALALEPCDRIADSAAFHVYLAKRGFAVPARALFDGILRAQVRAVMASNERLTHHGLTTVSGSTMRNGSPSRNGGPGLPPDAQRCWSPLRSLSSREHASFYPGWVERRRRPKC